MENDIGNRGEDYICHLRTAWKRFENSYQDKTRVDKPPHLVQDVLMCLREINYSKRDLIFELDIEPLTIDRWQAGGNMKPDTFAALKMFVSDVLDGKPRRPISAADTGFVSSSHLFEHRQPLATCIWYIAHESFLLNRSRSVKDEVVNLFLAKSQEEKRRPVPTLIYIYPRGSMTETSLRVWKSRLDDIGLDEELKGTVVGISLDEKAILKMPWFIPGLRIVMCEMRSSVEGYIRIKTPQPVHDALCKVMKVENEDLQAPWLSVNREAVEQWHTMCEERFAKRILKARQDQQDDKKSFKVTILDAEA